MPKIGSAGTVHVSIVRRRQPDGSTYVQEVRSVYNPIIQNNKVIGSKTLGTLPPGETDLTKLIPPKKRGRKPTKESAQTILEKAKEIQDTRREYLTIYPLDLTLLVVLLAGLAGYSSCRQIAEYWKLHRPLLKTWFEGFPDRDIFHDTVRSVLKIVGKTDANNLIRRFTAPLVDQYNLRVVGLDGQAVRAASSEEHKAHSRYVLNLYDTDNELCLQQVLIEEKKNEISEAVNLVKAMDLSGAVVTCDALNTQRKFAQCLIEEKHCDYCFAVKENQPDLYGLVQGWFKTRRSAKEARTTFQEEDGHGRHEERETRVLPASILKAVHQDVLDKWAGLEDGCIVIARTKRSFKNDPEKDSDDVRYFISSLNFDRTYIAETMARVIRRYWRIENSLHRVLDVTFSQDRTQCRNGDYLAGRTATNKVIFNLLSKAQVIEERETGKDACYKPSMKVRFSTPQEALKQLYVVYKSA